jgi:hypothetical protein
MVNVPGIRAGWPKLAVSFVKHLASPHREAIFEQLGEARTRIREASFRDYVTLEDFALLADATFGALGLVPARNLWRDVMVEALKQPAVGELVRRAGVGNEDPVPLLERTADAFRFVHKRCGEWTVAANATTRKAVVVLEKAPAITVASSGMQAAYWGNLSAAFVSLGIEARLSVSAEPADRRLRFRAHW